MFKKYFLLLISVAIFFTSSTCFANNLPADQGTVRVPEFARSQDLQVTALELAGRTYNQVEVLFIYSPETLALYGSLTEIENKVAQVIKEANLILANSRIRLRVSSVGLQPSPVAELNDAELELHAIANNAEVQAIRMASQADVVSFLVSHTSNNKHCGVAYELEAMNEFSSLFAYQVLSLNVVCADWVFAHELGHNLGAQHDLENSPNPGLFTTSYGHRLNIQGIIYRTVMAYEPGVVIPYFSSPNNFYLGTATGTSEADNAGTLEISRNFVASYFGNSTIELTPQAEFKRKVTAKACKFTVSLKNFQSDTSVEFYARLGKKRQLLKSKIIDENTRSVKVARGLKAKFVKAIMTDSVGTLESSEIKCRPIQ